MCHKQPPLLLVRVLILLAVFLALGGTVWSATPTIVFTHIPTYGDASDVYLKGKVTGVDVKKYVLAPYIKVGDAYWTKPTYAYPTVGLNSDGTWEAYVVSGGHDEYATKYMIFLVPVDDTPPQMDGSSPDDPVVPEAIASATVTHGPAQKTISFAGYNWDLKRRDFDADPGQNRWLDDTTAIWKDSGGLHLTCKRVDGKGQCTEAILKQNLGYGVYTIQVHGRLDNLDPNLVAAPGFTYDLHKITGHRENDFEFAKWNKAIDSTNAQFVVQPIPDYPWGNDPHGVRYTITQTDSACDLTLFLFWCPGSVEFKAYYGKWLDSTPPETALVKAWVYTGNDAPTPGQENLRFNFWSFDGTGPSDGVGREYVISGFKFSNQIVTPTPTPTPAVPPIIQFKNQPASIKTNLSDYTIYGYYPDATTVKVDDVAVELYWGGFAYGVPLNEGANQFTVVAYDADNKVLESATKKIVRDSGFLTANVSLLYCSSPAGGTSYIDLDHQYVIGDKRDVPFAPNTSTVKVDPSGKYQFATSYSWASGEISITNLSTNEVTSIGGLADFMGQTAFSQDGRYAFVGGYGNSWYGGGGIYTVDLSTLSIVKTNVQFGASSVAFGPGGFLYSTSHFVDHFGDGTHLEGTTDRRGVDIYTISQDGELTFKRSFFLNLTHDYATYQAFVIQPHITAASNWVLY